MEKKYKPPRFCPVVYMLFIYALCSIAKDIEFLYIRTDETIFADNFINKLFGIIVLAIAVKLFGYTWESLGFKLRKIVKGTLVGLMLGVVTFVIAYSLEFVFLTTQGLSPKFEVYVSGFSLTGSEIKNTGFFFSMCIGFNIINVVMEEGVFRGLFIKLGQEKYSFLKSNLIAASFFGIWHFITPLRSFIDGSMTFLAMATVGIAYIIVSGIMGIKWGLWLNTTGFIWIGMAEHFFNNTIGNLFHVVTSDGVDELQIIRILIAQLLSLAIALIVRYTKLRNYFS